MPLHFTKILLASLFLSAGFALFLFSYTNSPIAWSAVPLTLAIVTVSLIHFQRVITEKQALFYKQLAQKNEKNLDITEPLGLTDLIKPIFEKSISPEIINDLINKLSTGETLVDKELWKNIPEAVTHKVENYLKQTCQGIQTVDEVILSIQSADFGNELTLKRSQAELSQAYESIQQISDMMLKMRAQGADRKTVVNYLTQYLQDNKHFETVWCGWEENAFDKKDSEYLNKTGCDNQGRFLPICSFSEKNVIVEELVDFDVPGLGDFYLQPKEKQEAQVIAPYLYSVDGHEILMTTYSMPIMEGDKVLGVVGIDISLMDKLSELSDNLPDQASNTVKNSVDAMLTLKSALSEVNRVLFYMANGEFKSQIERELPGDLNSLKEAVNRSTTDLHSAFSEINRTMNAFSNGDLTQTTQGHYQGDLALLTSDINRAVDNLHGIIVQAAVTSDQVVESIQKMQIDNQTLDQRTKQQATSIIKTASSMKELTQTINNTAEDSNSATELGGQVKNHVEKGSEIVSNTLDSMTEISQASEKISDFVQLIESIAFQTNLLALNAAVEAARAGEHGRGFAVVAGEVRNLAQKSAEASTEIKKLVDQNLAIVKQGQNYTNESAKAFSEINLTINPLVDIVSDINIAAKQEMASIEQVNMAISQLDQFTQDNAKLSGETAKLGHTMSDRATELKTAISSIKL